MLGCRPSAEKLPQEYSTDSGPQKGPNPSPPKPTTETHICRGCNPNYPRFVPTTPTNEEILTIGLYQGPTSLYERDQSSPTPIGGSQLKIPQSMDASKATPIVDSNSPFIQSVLGEPSTSMLTYTTQGNKRGHLYESPAKPTLLFQSTNTSNIQTDTENPDAANPTNPSI